MVVESGPPGSDPARYSQRVELPTRSQKVLTVYARVDSISSLSAYFTAGNDRVNVSSITLRPARGSQQIVGVVADDAVVGEEIRRALINAYGTSRVEVVVFPPDQITGNTYGLNSFSGIVIGDATTGRWSAEQRAALASWVARGGRLIVTGGPNARKVAEGLGDLAPLRPRDSVTANGLTALGSAVLAGSGDFSRHNPIHRWWGGTELTNDRLWRWDPANHVLIAPSSTGA